MRVLEPVGWDSYFRKKKKYIYIYIAELDTREETRVRRRGAEHSPETVLMFLGLTVPLLRRLKDAQVRPRVPPPSPPSASSGCHFP